MSPILIILGLVGVFLILFFVLRKKSKKPNNPDNPPETCSNIGEVCKSSKDCCGDTLDCKEGKCSALELSSLMKSFFLTFQGKCVLPDPSDTSKLKVSENACIWEKDIVPDTFFFWDGQSKLVLREPVKDTNGAISSINNFYIQPPTSSSFVNISDKESSLILSDQGIIYSLDYVYSIFVDGSGHLVWNQNSPSTFTFNQPQACSNDKCSDNSQCCPPYGQCVNGSCSTCMGDPEEYQTKNCPGSTNYVVCSDDSTYKCKSHCSTEAKCKENEHPVCYDLGNGIYDSICVSNCTEAKPSCLNGTEEPICSEIFNIWAWNCPVDPCNPPTPSPTLPPPPSNNPGYTLWNVDHYENVNIPTQGWIYPVWDCRNQKWTYPPASKCNTNFKQTCPSNEQAICGNETNFSWACANRSGTDLCGLSAKTDPNSVCVDIASCNPGGTHSYTDWTWISESNTEVSKCEVMEIENWKPQSVQGAPNDQIVFNDDGGIPIYPSIDNSRCRSKTASDYQRTDLISKIGNPSGNIDGDGVITNKTFTELPSKFSGDGDVYTKYQATDTITWYCKSENPCKNGGHFVNNDGSDYVPIAINAPSGIYGPPTTADLLENGKCVCPSGFAGSRCEYDNSVCGGNGAGVVHSCNTGIGNCDVNKGYACSCLPGHYGSKCEYTSESCSNHGNPDDSDTLKCNCSAGYHGSLCQCPDSMVKPVLKILTNTAREFYKFRAVNFAGVQLAIDNRYTIGNINGNNFSIGFQGKVFVADFSHEQMILQTPGVILNPLDWHLSECGIVSASNQGVEYYVKVGNSSSPDKAPGSDVSDFAMWLVPASSINNFDRLVYLFLNDSKLCTTGTPTGKSDIPCTCSDATWSGKYCQVHLGTPGTPASTPIVFGQPCTTCTPTPAVGMSVSSITEQGHVQVGNATNVWAHDTDDGSISLVSGVGRNYYLNHNPDGTLVITQKSPFQNWTYYGGELSDTKDYHGDVPYDSGGFKNIGNSNLGYQPPPRTHTDDVFQGWLPPATLDQNVAEFWKSYVKV